MYKYVYTNSQSGNILCFKHWIITKTKLRGLSPQANYTDLATTAEIV
jgi:hypothetical protein